MSRFGDAVYQLLLRAFPASFRERHGDEMLDVFQRQRRQQRHRPLAIAWLWLQAVIDAIVHGLALRRAERAAVTAGAGRRLFLRDDLRDGWRGWRRDRVTLVVIVGILTAGIGANATMFGVVDQLLLTAPMGTSDTTAIRRVYFATDNPERAGQAAPFRNHAYPFISAIRSGVTVFGAAAATSRAEVTIGAGLDARPATVEMADAEYFTVLGVRPAMGRFYGPAEDGDTGAAPVAVVSHGFWQNVLAGRGSAIGQTLRVQGATLTVVGIAPPGFSGIDDEPADLWVPLGTLAATVLGPRWMSSPGLFRFGLVARLTPGATSAQADAQATTIYRASMAGQPVFLNDPLGTAVGVPLERLRAPGGLRSEGRVGLWLLGVSAVVLVIAVTNVSGLLLTRALVRRKEIAVRLALGVSRPRLVRQLVFESSLLVAPATLAALAVAYGGGRLVQQLLLPGFAWSPSVVDLRVLLVTLSVGALTAIGAGLVPAWQACSTDLLTSLRASPQLTGRRTSHVQSALLVTQVALCAVLLIGAGLFVRSLVAARAHDVGIDLDRVVQVRLPTRPGMEASRVRAEYDEVLARLAALPGVERVTLARGSAPMTTSSAWSVLPEGWTLEDISGRSMPQFFAVDQDYFTVLGASLKRGRALTADDARLRSRVAVINQALAADFWPNVDPLGRCLSFGAGADCTRIVGIVEDTMTYDRLDTSAAQLYVGHWHPDVGTPEPRAILIRASSDAPALVPPIRRLIQSLSPDMPYVPIDTLDRIVAPQLQPWRLGTTMFLVFGGIALLVATVGLYSAIAHAVSQRRHEIGIRIALGASPRRLVLSFTRRGAAPITAGLVLGVAAAAVGARWLGDLLYDTSPYDPLVLFVVVVTLGVAGLAATFVPARRVSRVDPLAVLKVE